MTRPRNKKEQDLAIRAYYNIPDKKKIRKASFLQLSEWLSECDKGTAKFYDLEREVYRRKSRDQMWATILGAVIGGIFTLVGAFVASPFLISHISEQLQGNTRDSVTQNFVGETSERQIPEGTANTKETGVLKNSADNLSIQKSGKEQNDKDTDYCVSPVTGAETAEKNTVTLTDCDHEPKHGFSFTLGLMNWQDAEKEKDTISQIDIFFDYPHGLGANNRDIVDDFTGSAGIIDMGAISLDDVKEAPKTGYLSSISMDKLLIGHTYCIRTSDGKHYGLINLTAINKDKHHSIQFTWKYQKAETRTF